MGAVLYCFKLWVFEFKLFAKLLMTRALEVDVRFNELHSTWKYSLNSPEINKYISYLFLNIKIIR